MQDAGTWENGSRSGRVRSHRPTGAEGAFAAKDRCSVDFTQLYEMAEPLYCEDNGRPSIDPVVLFKMVLIQHLYGLPSLRRTAEEVSANICYRWFLGYTLQEETPHFSTVSYCRGLRLQNSTHLQKGI